VQGHGPAGENAVSKAYSELFMWRKGLSGPNEQPTSTEYIW
jgi:hypothetical protein